MALITAYACPGRISLPGRSARELRPLEAAASAPDFNRRSSSLNIAELSMQHRVRARRNVGPGPWLEYTCKLKCQVGIELKVALPLTSTSTLLNIMAMQLILLACCLS